MLVEIASRYYQILPTTVTKLAQLPECLQQLQTSVEIHGIDSAQTESCLKQIEFWSGINDYNPTKIDLAIVTEQELVKVLNAIAVVNFPPPKETTEEPSSEQTEIKTLPEHAAYQCAMLVNAGLVTTLDSALAIAEKYDHILLDNIIKERVNFLNRDRIDDKKEAEDLMKELQDGSFWGTPKDGKDGFRDGVMQAMGIRTPVPKKDVDISHR
jgi:hypothetical protein